MADTGKELEELAGALVTVPGAGQRAGARKADYMQVPAIADTVKRAEKAWPATAVCSSGSGTEPLLASCSAARRRGD